MNPTVRVRMDEAVAVLELFQDRAPRAVEAFLGRLPIDGDVRHVRWSGEAGYIAVKELAIPDMTIENPVSFYPPGCLMYRPGHGELALAYGQAQARDLLHLADRACLLGRFEGAALDFWARVSATKMEGKKPVRFEKSEG